MRRAGEAGKRVEYLAFVLAGETYAVPIAHVAEILRPPPITEVPRAPRNVLGVISVRGKLVTVIDLRRRFRLAEAPLDRKTRILLADPGEGRADRAARRRGAAGVAARRRGDRAGRTCSAASSRRTSRASGARRTAGAPSSSCSTCVPSSDRPEAKERACLTASVTTRPRTSSASSSATSSTRSRSRACGRSSTRSTSCRSRTRRASVAGVADYRGEVVPVVDLRARFGLTLAPATQRARSGSSSTSPVVSSRSSSTP